MLSSVRRCFLRLFYFDVAQARGCVVFSLMILGQCRHELRFVLREDCTEDRVCVLGYCLLEICEMLIGWFESYM